MSDRFVCSGCGTEAWETDQFCKDCGRRLGPATGRHGREHWVWPPDRTLAPFVLSLAVVVVVVGFAALAVIGGSRGEGFTGEWVRIGDASDRLVIDRSDTEFTVFLTADNVEIDATYSDGSLHATFLGSPIEFRRDGDELRVEMLGTSQLYQPATEPPPPGQADLGSADDSTSVGGGIFAIGSPCWEKLPPGPRALYSCEPQPDGLFVIDAATGEVSAYDGPWPAGADVHASPYDERWAHLEYDHVAGDCVHDQQARALGAEDGICPVTELSVSSRGLQTRRVALLVGAWGFGLSSWTRDGRVAMFDGADGNVLLVDVDAGTQSQMTMAVPAGWDQVSGSAIGPNGERIFVPVWATADSHPALLSIDLASGSATPLLESDTAIRPLRIEPLAFDAAGDRLLVTYPRCDSAGAGCTNELWIVHLESESTNQVPTPELNVASAVWAPDGQNIAITHVGEAYSLADVSVIALDGTVRRQLTSDGANFPFLLDWASD